MYKHMEWVYKLRVGGEKCCPENAHEGKKVYGTEGTDHQARNGKCSGTALNPLAPMSSPLRNLA